MAIKFNLRLAFLVVTAIVYPIICSTMTPVIFTHAFTTDPSSISVPKVAATKYDKVRREWNEKSVSYYSKLMREERRKKTGQIDSDILDSEEYQQEFKRLATKHYFALRKIKEGRYEHAEIIYRRIIREIMNEDEDGDSCDHAKLAVTTLLLALHCQRMGDVKKTRSVFLNFFRQVVMSETRRNESNNEDDLEHDQCACSAKVLGAFALFEMKQGNTIKSLEIARKAVEFDPTLGPILEWKQFREVRQRTKSRTKTKLAVAKDRRQP